MKIIHLSDLHIGKRVNEFSMIEDQRYVFKQIIEMIEEEKPDAVLIAGDVYDKSIPSEEAVALCDELITSLGNLPTKTCIISGNHDSAERLSFGSALLKKAQINIASVFNKDVELVEITGKTGERGTRIYMLPFIKPSSVRRFFLDKNIVTYDDAVHAVISSLDLDTDYINILMVHQFISGYKACESEDLSIGTLDQVRSEHFKEFDYVALGHIHGPQNLKLVNKDGRVVPVRYCGTPLKYSFSEMNHQKSVTVVEIEPLREQETILSSEVDQNDLNVIRIRDDKKKIQIIIRTKSLHPLHEMREIKGTYEELTSRDFYKDMDTGDYFHVILTDEEDIPNALARMRSIYPNIMRFDYDNTRTREKQEITKSADVEKKTPQQLFTELYEMQNNKKLSAEQNDLLNELVEEIWK